VEVESQRGTGGYVYGVFAGTAMNSSHIFNSLESLKGGERLVFTGRIKGSTEIPYAMGMMSVCGFMAGLCMSGNMS
jgi:hypothetical protein